MKRKIIKIDENKCNGCGLCIPNCAEGALQIIDGKARLISDLFCDGLGACLGHCPEGAIEVEEREAEPYDEVVVMEQAIVPAGEKTILAHLLHLQEHGEHEYLRTAYDYLKRNNIENPLLKKNSEDLKNAIETAKSGCSSGTCPGSTAKVLKPAAQPTATADSEASCCESQLGTWPVQLHLLSPMAPFLKKADLLLAADCTAFAAGNFHNEYLKGKVLAVACPKLDSGLDVYREKLTAMIDGAELNTITVLMMEVPCCSGLGSIVREAVAKASRKVPVKHMILGTEGLLRSEEWV